MASKDKAGGPGVGFEYPRRPATWLKRDALLFAQSIGGTADELHFLYVSCEKSGLFCCSRGAGEPMISDKK